MAEANFIPFPTVSPAGAPNDYSNVRATPEAFGSQVAVAQEKTGAAITGVGTELFNAAIARAELNNELLANDANTEATKSLGDLFGKFSQQQGKNAAMGVDDYKNAVTDTVKNAIDQMPNLKARTLLSNSLRYMGDRYINYGQMHADTEGTKYQHQSAINAADEHANQAMLAATNDDSKGMDVSLEAGAQQYVKIAEQTGLNNEGADALVHHYKGGVLSAIIKTEIDQGNLEKAQAIYSKYKDQMDVKSILATENAIKPAQQKLKTENLVQDAASPSGKAGVNRPSFLGTLLGAESGGRNVSNITETTSSGQAQGYFQITTGTWKEFAQRAGIDLNKYPTALSAPYGVQAQVAGIIPIARWAPETLDKLRKAGYHINTNATLAENIAANGGDIMVATPAEGAMAPKSVAYERIIAATGDDLNLQRAALSRVNQLYTDWNIETATQQKDLQDNVPRMIADAESGNVDPDQIPFDPEYIRRFMPSVKAEQWIGEFDTAKKISQFVKGFRWASPEEVTQAQEDLANGRWPIGDLLTKSAADPSEHYRLQSMGNVRLSQMLQERQKALSTDPAKFVQSNPTVDAAFKTIDNGDPKSFEKYAIASLTVQNHLGIDGQFSHILTKFQADEAVKQITSNAGEAKTSLNLLQARSGAAWPQVYSDLVTLGKMPAEYQAMQVLTDPGDLTIMSKALQEMNKDPTKGWAFRLGGGDSQAGAGIKKGLDTAITAGMADYDNSLRQSGASERDIENIDKAVQILAYGNQFFNNDPAAATKAVQSFVGQYSYIAQGGARVPTAIYPTVNLNAQKMLNGITADNVKIPEGAGQPGQPSSDAYLAWVKSAPEWVTAPTGDRLLLREPGGMGRGRFVRGNDGQPISVMFAGANPFSSNFSLPNPETPRIGVTSETKPGGEPIEGFSDAASKAIQIYRNSLMESGSFTPDQVEKKVTEYKTNFRRAQPMPGGNR